MRLIGLFFIISLTLNLRALNAIKNNICAPGERLFPLNCSHPLTVS